MRAAATKQTIPESQQKPASAMPCRAGVQENDAVCVLWANQLYDAVVTLVDRSRGHKCIHVQFQTDGKLGWVTEASVQLLCDPEKSAIPSWLKVGHSVYSQFEPGIWYRAEISSVKQSAVEGAGKSRLLFWVRFECDSTHQWCTKERLRPGKLATANQAAGVSVRGGTNVKGDNAVHLQLDPPELNVGLPSCLWTENCSPACISRPAHTKHETKNWCRNFAQDQVGAGSVVWAKLSTYP